jgi:hypothetical protein
MIVEVVALTCGVAIGVVASTLALIVAAVRVLRALDLAVDEDERVREPEWWPEFEAAFAEYSRHASPGG